MHKTKLTCKRAVLCLAANVAMLICSPPTRADVAALAIQNADNGIELEVGEALPLNVLINGQAAKDEQAAKFVWNIVPPADTPTATDQKVIQLLPPGSTAGGMKFTPVSGPARLRGVTPGSAKIHLTYDINANGMIETGEQKDFDVRVKPLDKFHIVSQDKPLPKTLLIGEKLPLKVLAQTATGKAVDLSEVTIKSSDPDIAVLSTNADLTDPKAEVPVQTGTAAREVYVKARGSGTLTLTLAGWGKEPQPYSLTVKAPRFNVNPTAVELVGNQDSILRAVRIPVDGRPTIGRVRWTSEDTSWLQVTPQEGQEAATIKAAKDVPGANQQVRVTAALVDDEGNVLAEAESPAVVTLKPKVGKVALDIIDPVILDHPAKARVRLTSPDGTEIEGRPFTFEISDTKVLHVNRSPDKKEPNLLILRGLHPGSAVITIKSGGEETKITVAVDEISDFTHVQVKFTALSEQDAADLFGPQVAQNFFVINLSVLNNLRGKDGRPLGKSVLAFADTIRARVVLEKRYDPKSRVVDARSNLRTLIVGENKRDWTMVTSSDNWRIFSGPRLDERLSLTPPSVTALSTAQSNPIRDKPDPVIVVSPKSLTLREGESTTLKAVVVDASGAPIMVPSPTEADKTVPAPVEWISTDGRYATVTPAGVVTGVEEGNATLQAVYRTPQGALSARTPVTVTVIRDNRPLLYTYYPYNFDLMVGSAAVRDRRNPRAMFFNLLDTAGTFASFLTAVNVFRGSAPVILDTYSNLLVPGLQRALPDLQETQRQNLLTRTMRPIEQVPYGSTMNKVLFFPRKAFKGYLPGYWTRISAIDVNDVKVDIAVIERQESVGNTSDGPGSESSTTPPSITPTPTPNPNSNE
jgi:hypothetical protein